MSDLVTCIHSHNAEVANEVNKMLSALQRWSCPPGRANHLPTLYLGHRQAIAIQAISHGDAMAMQQDGTWLGFTLVRVCRENHFALAETLTDINYEEKTKC